MSMGVGIKGGWEMTKNIIEKAKASFHKLLSK